MSGETFLALGNVLLIVEQIKEQPKPLGLGLPSVKINDYLKIDASHKKIERRIYRTAHEAELISDNEQSAHRAGLLNWFSQFVTPNHRMHRTPNATRYALAYIGFKNVFSLEKNLGVKPTLALPYICFYGSDPAPNVNLFENPKITFTNLGGGGPAIGAAFYHLDRQLLVPQVTSNTAQLFESLCRLDP